ncbi:MAG: hypothetical protein GY807_24035 [Gammaproteobacteria bacterium]|nr:hypothetical protein [Gammaproteobacteria bacterium]
MMDIAHARELLSGANGLYVGILDEDEIQALNILEEAGEAMRSYEGPGGFLGLSKVRLLQRDRQQEQKGG